MSFLNRHITPDTEPQSEAEMLACLASWEWRIFSGKLYKITTKGDDAPDDEPELAAPFIPNAVQRNFLANIHNRNIILKARQLGLSTCIDICALDHAMFNADQEVVVIAHTQSAATKLYRKKVCFAYDNLPEFVRNLVPTIERSQTQMVFKNGSSIEVSSSARGGTPHFLHISEFGKIAAKYPEKATEITTGALQGVPKTGLVFIESTAEGKSGSFYEMSNRAQKLHEAGSALGIKDYRLHFYAWFTDAGYVIDPKTVTISAKEHEYFDGIETYWLARKVDCMIDLPQRAWYVATRDSDFVGDPDLMWREYPSTPEEAWQASTEGFYYAKVLQTARRQGRIGHFPMLRHVPVNSFWDVGATDSTAVWLHQRVELRDLWIGFKEDQDEGYMSMILWMEALGFVWGTHFLPHDASHKVKGIEDTRSAVAKLRQIRPTWDWQIVPRVSNIQHGIDAARLDFATYHFNEDGVGIKEGIAHLESYRREWNTALQAWGNQPLHDAHSHAADAFRQKAQGYTPGAYSTGSDKRKRPRSTGMTA